MSDSFSRPLMPLLSRRLDVTVGLVVLNEYWFWTAFGVAILTLMSPRYSEIYHSVTKFRKLVSQR